MSDIEILAGIFFIENILNILSKEKRVEKILNSFIRIPINFFITRALYRYCIQCNLT